jgi:mono/diheme cytochrome c family protein
MLARSLACWPIIVCLTAAHPAGAQSFTPRDEQPEDYPPGRGREETFYACTPCHGFRIVAQQGQTRRQWDDTLEWMIERFKMPSPADADRKAILDYLETAFPPHASPRGWQNPFQK